MKVLFAFCFAFCFCNKRSALKESSWKGVVCTGLLSHEKKVGLVFAGKKKYSLVRWRGMRSEAFLQ